METDRIFFTLDLSEVLIYAEAGGGMGKSVHTQTLGASPEILMLWECFQSGGDRDPEPPLLSPGTKIPLKEQN